MNAWIPYLHNPLVFVSFVLLLLIGLVKTNARAGMLTKKANAAILDKMLAGAFVVILLVLIGAVVEQRSQGAQVAKIKFNTAGPLVYIGTPEMIFATAYDGSGKRLSDKDLGWTTMNPEIVGVISAGNFQTGEGVVYQASLIGLSPGTAIIEAGRDGYNEKIQVTVSTRTGPAVLAPLGKLLPGK